jgi:hypothetical protein
VRDGLPAFRHRSPDGETPGQAQDSINDYRRSGSVTTIAFMGIVSSVICLFGALMGACRSRTNADDRLPADPLGRIESRDGIVEGCDVADVRPQPSVPHPPDDLTQ